MNYEYHTAEGDEYEKYLSDRIMDKLLWGPIQNIEKSNEKIYDVKKELRKVRGRFNKTLPGAKGIIEDVPVSEESLEVKEEKQKILGEKLHQAMIDKSFRKYSQYISDYSTYDFNGSISPDIVTTGSPGEFNKSSLPPTDFVQAPVDGPVETLLDNGKLKVETENKVFKSVKYFNLLSGEETGELTAPKPYRIKGLIKSDVHYDSNYGQRTQQDKEFEIFMFDIERMKRYS